MAADGRPALRRGTVLPPHSGACMIPGAALHFAAPTAARMVLPPSPPVSSCIRRWLAEGPAQRLETRLFFSGLQASGEESGHPVDPKSATFAGRYASTK